MYGLFGQMSMQNGKPDELAKALINGIANMLGCNSYIVANDSLDANGLWITDAWQDQHKHAQSLSLSPVVDATTKGRPLIAGFGEPFETEPLGGQGLL
jgi:quinol monooxygenase YgiN